MKVFLLIVLMCFSEVIRAQDSIENTPPQLNEMKPVSSEINNSPPLGSEIGAPTVISVMTTNELWLSFSVLIFGFLVMVIELYLIKINQFDSHQAVKFILVTLVITSALFLIAAGFSNNQIASAMGLFGTIAGYLLGRSQSETTSTNKNAQN